MSSQRKQLASKLLENTKDEITSAELEAVFNTFDKKSVRTSRITSFIEILCSKNTVEKNKEELLEKWQRVLEFNMKSPSRLHLDEFLKAVSIFHDSARIFHRPRSNSLRDLDPLGNPPPGLMKKNPTKLAPTDRIAKPMITEGAFDHVPCVCKDCGGIYNYHQGHICDAIPSFAMN